MTKKQYNWEKWFGQKKFVLKKGVHYTCSQTSMRTQIGTAACAYQVSIKVKVDSEGTFTVLVTQKEN
jgi:hypothetical protein